jgi:DNA helicase-2/ATP-dependent DNA helicase PcrA
MDNDFLNELNEHQREAVLHTDGPSLIIAGAGSGKTRVLTYRVAWLLTKGVPANRILALTFTNKAAREMRERIRHLVGEERSRYLWMGTFHSIFARILRSEAHLLGYSSSYSIYDTSDSRNLLKTIIKELRLDDKVYKPSTVHNKISWAKNMLITAGVYSSLPEITQHDAHTRMDRMSEIYKIYARRCHKADAMDFDDLLLNMNILFRDFPQVLEKYRDHFRYILVDEYQDTNMSQYMIVKRLSEEHKNLSVVGDDAQSIYSFRGARIENILNFQQDFPEAKLFKLEQNYRSTRNIVNVANSIIRNNAGQIPKEVYSRKEDGPPIEVLEADTDKEEAFLISNKIFDGHLQAQLRYGDFAILYRTNAQSRAFEEALRRRNIPYRVWGGVSFYQRKEIKDVLAYFRLVVNNNDDEAFKRIINYPSRGIGKTTVEKLEAAAEKHNRTLWEVADNPEAYGVKIHGGTKNRIAAFVEMIRSFSARQDQLDAYELAYQITQETGILKDLHGPSPEEVSKYENVKELLNGISEFIGAPEQEGRFVRLDEFLQNVVLLTDQDTDDDTVADTVKIMTIHSAKGLEFRHVFIAGLEENLFPSQMSLGTQKELEEERRLFYVAITRAREYLTLTYANTRYKWGSITPSRPSRFLRELDPRYVNFPDFASLGGANSNNTSPGEMPAGRSSAPSHPPRRRKVIYTSGTGKSTAPGFVPDDPRKIKAGMEVEHARFGTGKVLQTEGEFPDTKATVFFKDFGQKQLLLKFAKLKIIDPVV